MLSFGKFQSMQSFKGMILLLITGVMFTSEGLSQTTVNLASQCDCEVTNGSGAPTTSSADVGDLYVDTDTGVTYYWDGTSWSVTSSNSTMNDIDVLSLVENADTDVITLASDPSGTDPDDVITLTKDNSWASHGTTDREGELITDNQYTIGSITWGNTIDGITGGTNNSATNSAAGGTNVTVTGADALGVGENNFVRANAIIMGGKNNTATGRNSLIVGESNTVNAVSSMITGFDNSGPGGDLSIIGGNGNVVNGSRNMVVGIGNTVASNANIVGGLANVNANASATGNSLFVGTRNTFVQGTDNVIAGQDNSIEGSENIMAGDGNTLVGNRNLVIGEGNSLDAFDSSILAGTGIIATLDNTAYADNLLTTSGGVGTISDARLKSNISNLTYGLTAVLALETKQYVYNSDKAQRQNFGFLAQDIQKIMPEIILDNALSDNDDNSYMGMRYQDLIPVLVNAIQEQQKQIEELKSKIK